MNTKVVNTNLLKGRITSEGYTQQRLAPLVGMSANSLNAKVNGRKKFDTEEAVRICHALRINDPIEKCDIFLSHNSHLWELPKDRKSESIGGKDC